MTNIPLMYPICKLQKEDNYTFLKIPPNTKLFQNGCAVLCSTQLSHHCQKVGQSEGILKCQMEKLKCFG
jgi:hypothetical protein